MVNAKEKNPATCEEPPTSVMSNSCWTTPIHPWSAPRESSATATTGLLNGDGTLPASAYAKSRRVTVLVDSRDRDYDIYRTSSQFVLRLPESLHNVVSAVLISAELPATYHVFSAAAGNTSLHVAVNGTPHTITIPDGNYTVASLTDAINAAFTAALGEDILAFGVNPVSNMCDIVGVSVPNVAIDIDCTAATLGNAKRTNWGLGYYLGFPRDQVTSGPGRVGGTRVVSVDPEAYFIVDIDELNGVSETAMFADGGTRAAFAKIPLTQKGFGQYSFYDKTLVCNELRPPRARLDRLSISIRYHDGTLVNLNGGEWSATIELTCTQTRVD